LAVIALDELQLFARVAHTGNLSQAARELDRLPATVSAAIQRLEREVGAPLFVRTTRSMRLTPEGVHYLAHVERALAELEDGRIALEENRRAVRGLLRISMPSDFGRSVLRPMLDSFLANYPDVQFACQFSDRPINIYAEPIDIAIRSGKLDSSSMVAFTLAQTRRVIVASPAYWKLHGKPHTPQELVQHNCLRFHLRGALYQTWQFKKGTSVVSVRVQGNRSSDDATVVRDWAVAGHGIAYKAWLDVAGDVRDRRLVLALTEYAGEAVSLTAIVPDRRSASPTVRTLITHLKAQIARLPASPPDGKKDA
jgi:DNA-binding transcriptional LysR family regulator